MLMSFQTSQAVLDKAGNAAATKSFFDGRLAHRRGHTTAEEVLFFKRTLLSIQKACSSHSSGLQS